MSVAATTQAVSWWTVLVIAAGAYGFKAAGWFGLGRLLSGARVRHISALLPPALLAGLVVTQTFVADQNDLVLDERAAGVLAGGLAVYKNAPFWLVVVIAGAVTATLRAFS